MRIACDKIVQKSTNSIATSSCQPVVTIA